MIGQIYDVEYVMPLRCKNSHTFQKALDISNMVLAYDNHTTPDPFSYLGIGHFYLLYHYNALDKMGRHCLATVKS